mgnify:FL=1|tara:strand:- start:151 stop:654 length:504 start_codon:yes stop_codon:yes gene_type:complete
MNKKTLNQMNLMLVTSLSIVYLAHLSSNNKYNLTLVLVGIYLGLYMLTKTHLSSMFVSVLLVLTLEFILNKFTTLEGFKNKSRRKRKKIETFDDDDEVNESYIDLGSSFLEAYKSLTPKQLAKMSNDTKSLLGQQKQLIETLDNIGPVLKSGKHILEQFKHYFKDEI